MQTSSQPKLLPIPFADAGTKQDIPNDSQIGITAGRASYSDGFPPLTRTPLAAGGVPPFGTDFNGVLNDITAAVRWTQAGAGYPFNTAFNTAVSGYPKGARIPNSTLDGFWLNTVDGNTTNPENTTAAITGWVPSGNYGSTAITGLSGSSVTLTTLQASKERITLTGALTANINLVVPAWVKRWTFVNSCTGNFNVTVKTPSGSGISIPSGITASLVGNGTNIIQDAPLLGVPGRLINTQTFSSPGTYTYTPTPGAKAGKVIVTGAGGLGLGNTSTSAPPGAGGGAGGTAIKFIKNLQSSYSIVVGAPATTPVRSGSSSFGAECAATGGNAASGGAGGDPGIGSGGDINIYGGSGSDAADPALGSGSGDGGASYWGGGQRGAGNVAQTSIGAPGGGGGGNRAQNIADRYKGLPGIVYIEEYS
ncbi:hypothetical protein K5Y32_07045 [Pantoea sp. DY-15]|uniref:glycine-rich domain-containing protein n=1 Tax=Pantoea sp. DY-15 TaxID=2871489 RepID=UPI001C93D381|nr:hypothetical protein [Pantoea sp. DY-15]MBY4887687.1 hypothetical protein [Pantoea sp. DY-15]